MQVPVGCVKIVAVFGHICYKGFIGSKAIMEGGEMTKADIKLLTPSGSHNLLFSVPYFAM